MIITQKKPVEELLAMLEGVTKVAIVGCAQCAAACQTGGEKEVQEMKALLEEHGMEVVGAVLPDECCHKLLVKRDLKALRDAGAQANTMFLGQVERVGMFNEYCKMCGDCVLGSTGGICPITKCAKSLVNGPCGGQKNGKCEVNPDNDCAWILIYNRLVAIGQEHKLGETRRDKGYADVSYPRHINLREKKA